MTSSTAGPTISNAVYYHQWRTYYAESLLYVDDDESSVSINDASVVNVNVAPVGRNTNSVGRAVKDLVARALERGKHVFLQLRRLKGSSGPVRTPLTPILITTPHWDANAQLPTNIPPA